MFMISRHKHITDFLLLYILPVLLFGGMACRIFFGVDFTDESFYVAMATNFHRGSRPFIDEVNLLQMSAWLLRPLIALYEVWAPSLDGVVLFVRWCYLGFLMLLAVFSLRSLKEILGDKRLALTLALSCAAFIPFNIFSFSYNTLGSGCFAIGALLLVRFWLVERSTLHIVLAGLAHGITAMVYPSFVVPLAIVYALIFLWDNRSGWRYLMWYGLSASVVCAAVLLPIVHDAGWKNIAYCIDYTRSFGVQSFSNLSSMAAGIRGHGYVIVAWFVAFYSCKRRFPHVARLLIILFPLIWLMVGGRGMPHANWYVVNYGLAAPFLLLLLRDDVLAKHLFVYIWLPAIAVGATAAWSSSNAGIAAANGLIVGCVVTSILLARLYQHVSQSQVVSEKNYLLGHLSAPLIFLLLLFNFQFASVYRDAPISNLNQKILSGPYAGIYTTSMKASFASQLKRDIQAVQATKNGGGGMLVFDDFPAGYLFSSERPATNTAWLFPADIPQTNTARVDLVNRFYQEGRYPKLILKIKATPYDASGERNYSYPENDLLAILSRDRSYQLAVARGEYEIYTRRN